MQKSHRNALFALRAAGSRLRHLAGAAGHRMKNNQQLLHNDSRRRGLRARLTSMLPVPSMAALIKNTAARPLAAAAAPSTTGPSILAALSMAKRKPSAWPARPRGDRLY